MKLSFYGAVSYNFYLICIIDFLLQVGKAITHAYSRATRSCPWTGDLWARYLLALERGSASEKEIYDVSLNLLKLKNKRNIVKERILALTLIYVCHLPLTISDALCYVIFRKLC